MPWGKLGSTTLGSAGDDCDITSFTASKFDFFMFHKILSGSNAESTCTLNDNGYPVYSREGSDNFGTDFTSSGSNWNLQRLDTGDEFMVVYLCSPTGDTKLGIHANCSVKPITHAPEIKQQALKFTPNPDVTVTRIDFHNSNASGDYDTGTNVSALGSEGQTPSSAKIQDGLIFEETDTNKHYIYTASTDTWTEL